MNIEEVRDEYVARKKRDYDHSWAGTCERSTLLFLEYLNKEDIDIEDYEFDKLDIEDYKSLVEKQDNDYAGSTVKNMCMAVRDFIGYLNARHDVNAKMRQTEYRHDYSIYSADIEPDKGTRYEEETGEEIPYIRREEHEVLLKENKNMRDDVLLRLLWDTGCRPSELVNLKVDNIDRQKLYNGSVEVETAKRKDHKRDVHFGAITKRRLIKWLYKGGRNSYSSEARNSDYVFLTRRSKKMQPQLVNRQIKRLADSADIQEVAYTRDTNTFLHGEHKELERKFVRINAKSYRHSFAVRSCKNGMNLPQLADLMGHNGTESLKSYTKFLPDDNRQAWEEYTRR